MDVRIPEQEDTARLRRRVAELEARVAELEHAAPLREAQELYRALVETAFAGIAITDAEENLLFANPALGEIMGYAVEELVGANLSQFVESQEYGRYQELTEQRSRGLRNSYETRVFHKDGTPLHILISASPLNEENGAPG